MKIYKLEIKKEEKDNSNIFYIHGEDVFFLHEGGQLERLLNTNFKYDLKNCGDVLFYSLRGEEFEEMSEKISKIK